LSTFHFLLTFFRFVLLLLLLTLLVLPIQLLLPVMRQLQLLPLDDDDVSIAATAHSTADALRGLPTAAVAAAVANAVDAAAMPRF
jgi:hypothetical protein